MGLGPIQWRNCKKDKISKAQIEEIVKYIKELDKSRILVEDIQDIIEQKLMALISGDLARAMETVKINYPEIFV